MANVSTGPNLSLAGGTMSGPIVLPGNPAANLQAATKAYVDSVAAGATGYNASAVAITGGTVDNAVIGGTTPATATFTGITLPAAESDHGPFLVRNVTSNYYGTSGTLVGVTATTTNGSPTATFSGGHGVTTGQFVSIGSQGNFYIQNVATNTITLGRPATAGASGLAVQYVRINDPELSIGYNLNGEKVGEPRFMWNMEVDYLSSEAGGYRISEIYPQFVSSDGLTTLRPLIFSINRDLNTIFGFDVAVGTNGFRLSVSSGNDYVLRVKDTGQFETYSGSSAYPSFVVLPVTSSVNYLRAEPAATGTGPTLRATGGDANIDLTLATSGTGSVKVVSNTGLGVNNGISFGYSSAADRAKTLAFVSNSPYDTAQFNSQGHTGGWRGRIALGASYNAGSVVDGIYMDANTDGTTTTTTVLGKFIVSTTSTPASAAASGTTGTIAWDSSYIYVATGTNTWKRAALATW